MWKDFIVNVVLTGDAKLPKRSSAEAAGHDLFSTGVTETPNGIIIHTINVAVKIPDGYVGLIFPRSSIYKTGLMLANSVGVIDSDFTGEMKAMFIRTGKKSDKEYVAGDKICQLVIVPYAPPQFNVVDKLEETVRGSGGFGSTGR